MRRCAHWPSDARTSKRRFVSAWVVGEFGGASTTTCAPCHSALTLQVGTWSFGRSICCVLTWAVQVRWGKSPKSSPPERPACSQSRGHLTSSTSGLGRDILMAMASLHNSTDLLPHWKERGIDLSPSQIYRLVTGRPGAGLVAVPRRRARHRRPRQGSTAAPRTDRARCRLRSMPATLCPGGHEPRGRSAAPVASAPLARSASSGPEDPG